MAIRVTAAERGDAIELAAVAAHTFPLACPPASAPEDIALFIDTQLSASRFAEYLNDSDRVVLAAYDDGAIIGYCMLIRGLPDDDADVQRAVVVRPTVELSKMYVLPDSHGAGVSAALMTAALDCVAALPARSVWLGVNQQNRRAQRFYEQRLNGAR